MFKRLQRLISDIRRFKEWRLADDVNRRARQAILAVELQEYSYPDCLIATALRSEIPHGEKGIVAVILHNRTGREKREGRGTIEWALDKYVERRGQIGE